MEEIIKNRSELIFLYDIRDGNPNGDPMDQNKPRIDEETCINIVTDVRLKRTIRDYLLNFMGKEILVRTLLIDEEKGRAIKDAKTRALDFLDEALKEKKTEVNFNEKFENIGKNILKKCIDVRLFGVTLPIEKDKPSFTRTGPVQFNMGRSLHQVEIKHIKGTAAFASTTKKGDNKQKAGSKKSKEKTQQSFRDEYILNYSLICFHGLINENAAKDTLLTETDVRLLLCAMWFGTKSLISRTKVGQMPRLLLRVEYSEQNYHIGDLNRGIKLKPKVTNDLSIRGPEDYSLDVSMLLKWLIDNKEKIKKVSYLIDNQIEFESDDTKCDFIEVLKKGIGKEKVEMINCNFKANGGSK